MTGGGVLWLAHKALQAVLGALGVVARVARPYAPWILVAVLGAVAWHHLPVIGPRSQLARAASAAEDLRTAAREADAQAEAYRSGWATCENRRGVELDRADAALAEAEVSCLAQIADARRSARAIESIVTKEPTYVQSDPLCPAVVQRELVDPDRLRDALAPSSPR